MASGIAAGRFRAGSPALNTSMMRMAEPQHGQGLRGVGGSAAMSSGSGAGGATSSSLRASPRLSAFTRLANQEGDFIIRNYVFRSGETLPELKLHYRTLGTAKRNSEGKITNGVLLLQGNTGTSANWAASEPCR
jgi:hypothetical protein